MALARNPFFGLGPVVTGSAIGYGAHMVERAPQLPSRFALVTAAAVCGGALPADAAVEVRGGRLLHWGAAAEVANGRAVGVFDGVLFNAAALRERLAARGLSVADLDHAHLALEWLAAFGPTAVGDLRWHGSLALVHRAQNAVLLARDLVGVGWLGRADGPAGMVWSSDPRIAGEQQRAAPPGWVGIWSASGVVQPKVAYAPNNALYFREIPDEARAATAPTALDRAGELLLAAVAAHREALGGLDAAAIEGLGLPSIALSDAGGAVWSGAGLAAWRHPTAQLCERAADLRADGPHEPTATADPADNAERLWRWQTMPDGPLRAARIATLDAGRALAAPHLDPALLAWLGALHRSVRPAWLGAGDPEAADPPDVQSG